MAGELHIVSIYCKICVNCDDESLISDAEKMICKNHVNELFDIANKFIGNTNRIILTTDTGAAIAYAGLPTHAMLVAKELLNAILITNIQGLAPLSGRVGIHLKPVRIVNDFEDQPNIIGDVFKVAKQLITKAKPNQILVSRSYYDNLPPSIQAFSTLFYDPSMEHDSHVLAYQVYLSNLRKDQAALQKPTKPHQSNHETPKLQANKPRFKPRFLNASNWVHTLASLFIIVGLFSVAKLATTPS